MKLVLLVAFIALAYASNVVDLTPANFNSQLDGSRGAFVEFFAPWCGHCKSLAPEYEKVADAFVKASSDVLIAKVDADAHKDLGGRYGVTGFPTLLWFPKGKDHTSEPEKYQGGRTAEDIVSWIEQKSGARGSLPREVAYATVLTPSNFDKIALSEDKDVLVEFFAPWCGHCKKLKPDYEKVAKAFANEPSVVVATVDADAHKELGTRYGVTGFPTIKFFPKGSTTPEDYNGGREPQAFVDFLNNKAGTNRKVDGSLNENAGRLDGLDALAKKFLASTTREQLIADATDASKSYEGDDAKNAKFYVKVMELIASKGNGYVETELARLSRMISGGSLSGPKVDEFTKKANILKAFAA